MFPHCDALFYDIINAFLVLLNVAMNIVIEMINDNCIFLYFYCFIYYL